LSTQLSGGGGLFVIATEIEHPAITMHSSSTLAFMFNSSWSAQRPAHLPLINVLPLRLCRRLPLHILDAVGSAGAQRNDVILDVTPTRPCRPACGRTGLLALELARHRRVACRGTTGRQRQ